MKIIFLVTRELLNGLDWGECLGIQPFSVLLYVFLMLKEKIYFYFLVPQNRLFYNSIIFTNLIK